MKPHYSRSPAVSCKLSKCHWHSVKIRWTEQIFLPTRSQQQQQQQQDKVQSTTLLTTLTFDPGRTPFTANHYSQWSHKDPTRRDAHTSAPPPPTVSQKRWGFFLWSFQAVTLMYSCSCFIASSTSLWRMKFLDVEADRLRHWASSCRFLVQITSHRNITDTKDQDFTFWRKKNSTVLLK